MEIQIRWVKVKKRLITSALPYVNNVPHLGNLTQVLSADVFARFCRSRGYETLYICGTDEYGTASETRAMQEGVSPRELCDKYHEIHKAIYKWFNISFDYFGRTSTEKQTEIVQHIFNKVDEHGYISEREMTQLYCPTCGRFLADRFVNGECPNCHSTDARGDQCDNCGKLLDPTELINPKCSVCGSTPIVKTTKHLFINLPKALPLLKEWMDKASKEGFWANNAIQITNSWIRDGLQERCITRDLKWGIPVPKPGYEDKVFYVWFDAPIGYISITANAVKDWEYWWRDPENTELFQFIGKDNIPFHTVIFPSSLLATGEKWTMLHHMSSTEYLNYEGGKFSKSRGIGVFGNDVEDTGIPADCWRFYMFYNRPEKSDFTFTWKDFQDKVNKELIGNLSNLVNRTLSFIKRFYDGKLESPSFDEALMAEIRKREERITDLLEHAEEKDALHEIFALSDLGNKAFQDAEPWKKRTENPEEAVRLLSTLYFLIRDLAVMVTPYIPSTGEKILSFIGRETNQINQFYDAAGVADGNDFPFGGEVDLRSAKESRRFAVDFLGGVDQDGTQFVEKLQVVGVRKIEFEHVEFAAVESSVFILTEAWPDLIDPIHARAEKTLHFQFGRRAQKQRTGARSFNVFLCGRSGNGDRRFHFDEAARIELASNRGKNCGPEAERRNFSEQANVRIHLLSLC